jgi:hypothetical protein
MASFVAGSCIAFSRGGRCGGVLRGVFKYASIDEKQRQQS